MLRLRRRLVPWIAYTALPAVFACNLPLSIVTSGATGNQLAVPGITSSVFPAAPPAQTGTDTAMPSASATQTVAPSAIATSGSPTTISVTVRVAGGRLNIRRGPGPQYDTVGAILDGQSTLAQGRNEDGSWLYVALPNSSKALGWLTTKTIYTTVAGSSISLPVVSVAPALPAYIRNCTAHDMLVNPTGVILANRGGAPDNLQEFFPGEYSVTDQETDSVAADVTVFEGKIVEIKKDGSGKSYSCP